MVELAKGVNLHVFPSTKFKTISIKMYFKTKLTADNITKRSMIARLSETNSEEFPTQTAFQKALSALYGASFSADVSRAGQLHQVVLTLNIVNDKYLSVDNVTTNAMMFLKSILRRPNAQHGQFHPETFQREVTNLREDLESLSDDKQSYAYQQLKELYFDDSAQGMSIEGSLEALDNLSNEAVLRSFASMLSSDEIDIFVLGDITERKVINLCNDFDFQDRAPIVGEVFYHNETDELRREEEVQAISQAKLNMAYDTGVYYQTDDYIAGQVFNGLFGGFPHSKLFMNVREKESLAYYASSQMDNFRGVMYVRAGIDQAQTDHVIDLINEQLEAIAAGDFNEEAVVQTKEMIKNGLRQSDDNPSTIIKREHALNLVGQDLTLADWLAKVDAVEAKDIQRIARQVQLRSIYVLKGE